MVNRGYRPALLRGSPPRERRMAPGPLSFPGKPATRIVKTWSRSLPRAVSRVTGPGAGVAGQAEALFLLERPARASQ